MRIHQASSVPNRIIQNGLSNPLILHIVLLLCPRHYEFATRADPSATASVRCCRSGRRQPGLRRFLPDHNRRFGRAARETEKVWRPAPENLDRVCCFLHQRSVSNDNAVQWDGRRFQIPPQPQRFSFAGAKVQLYESLEGKVSIYYADTKLNLNGG